MESRNPRFKEYVEYKIARNHFMPWLGFEITRIEAGRIEGRLEFRKEHEQQNGYLHGGVTSAILDMVEGFAAYSLVEEGKQVFTVDARVSYYNRGMGKTFFARGWVDKAGSRFHFCEGELFYLEDGKEVIVAKGSSTMAVV